MTATLKDERRYRYEERLALLGCYGTPTADQHNIAVFEADAAVNALIRQDREDARTRFELLKEAL